MRRRSPAGTLCDVQPDPVPSSARPAPANAVRVIFAPAVAAIRRYWKPFLLLQIAAFTLVLAYYTVPPVRGLCGQLSALKQQSEYVFSAVAGALAGALLPEVAKAVMLADRKVTRQRLRDVGFAVGAFALNGIIIDLQYHLLAWMFGNDNHALTVIKKVIVDQLVLTPLYGTPYWIVVYEFRAQRYRLPRLLRQMSPRWYLDRVVPLLVSGWAYWTPMVLLIYVLPGPLQFCLYCFALAAWSLLIVFVATRPQEVMPPITPGVDPDLAVPAG